MVRTVIVVPCFDEAGRLPVGQFVDFVGAVPDVDLLFVDDGSRDATPAVLRAMAQRAPARMAVLEQQQNRGKAEAVRAGVNLALAGGADFVGYLDADLATPLSEVPRMLALLQQRPGIEMVFGARVHLLGRHIERRKVRHYLGRVFATAASRTLGLPVYDTQCGAKLFRRTPQLCELFAEPFLSRWVFDVEILARLIRQRRGTSLPGAGSVVYELPLDRWTDVAGSKVRATDFVRALWAMWRIRRRYLLPDARTGAPVRGIGPVAPALPRQAPRRRIGGS